MLYRDSNPSESFMVWKPSALNEFFDALFRPVSSAGKNWEDLGHIEKKKKEAVGLCGRSEQASIFQLSVGKVLSCMTERFQGNAGMVKRQKQCAVESHSLVFAAPAPKASQGDFFFLVCP